MTKPKRWPQNAEAARVESIAAARDAKARAVAAQAAIRQGKRDLALAMLAEVKVCLTEIELALRTCKG